MRLMREVRCFPLNGADSRKPVNSWSGCPNSGTREPFWTIRAVVGGAVDERTGFLCNIKEIDHAVREACIPLLVAASAPAGSAGNPEALALVEAFSSTAKACASHFALYRLSLLISPFLSLSVDREDPTMVYLTQSFEFCASHRLYVRDFSDDENRRVFGKCSNPNGHGHNYVVEVTVDSSDALDVETRWLNSVVQELVIDRFDHKHLNLDCEEFADLNPTVENLARVVWGRLTKDGAVPNLSKVRIWETPKTYAEFDGSE